MSILLKEQKILWSKSAGMCSMCKIHLVDVSTDGNVAIGENAHIQGEKPGSERYNKEQPDEERSVYQNLILLCPTCHTKIDKKENVAKYSVATLNKIKQEHESWVYSQTVQSINSVTYTELDNVIKYLIQQPDFIPDNLLILNPKEKIEKNNLSKESELLIKVGLMKVSLVKKYLNDHPDVEFADRLKSGYVKKYEEFKIAEYTSDEIFNLMLDFSSNNNSNLLQRSAGLAVLVYFFEQCDIFER